MKGILYKEEEGYYIFINTVILGTTRPLLNFDLVKYKLSLDNCEDIERDVPKNDLDGLNINYHLITAKILNVMSLKMIWMVGMLLWKY